MHGTYTGAVESLWLNRGFTRVWLAFTLSEFGTSVTVIVLPLMAVSSLAASPMEMAWLTAAETLPLVLFGLLAGSLADRWRRRPIMIAADFGRAAALLLIPLMAAMGTLNMLVLVFVAFTIGVGHLFFDVAQSAYVPFLVSRERVLEANSKLVVSSSSAESIGPALGGGLVQVLGFAASIFVNFLTFILSALLLLGVREREPRARAERQPGTALSHMLAGARFIVRNPLLRRLTIRLAMWHLIVGGVMALIVLFAVRELLLSPATVGLLFSSIGVGALVGALIAEPISRRLGVGPSIIAAIVLAAAGSLLIPLAGRWPALAVLLLGTAFFMFGLCVTIYQVNNASIRQAVTPDSHLGRVNASTRVMTLAPNAAGALLAGASAQTWGLGLALSCITAFGFAMALAGCFSTALRRQRDLPSVHAVIE